MRTLILLLIVAVWAVLVPLPPTAPPATEAQSVPAFRDAAGEAPPYAEDFTGPCRPRLLRTVVRHDLLALALESCPLRSTTLSYGAPSTTGSVTDGGDYAFLSDPDDLTSAVDTYEQLRNGTTTGLVIHQHDSAGTSQAAFYDLVEAGDLVEWREAADCFVRYTVTSASAPAAGAVIREFEVAWMTYAYTGCSGALSPTATASVQWGPLPVLGGTSLTAPIRHGLFFQIVPHNWTGETEPITWLPIPPGGFEEDTYADTVAEARRFPAWREPTFLPEGTRFRSAATGPEEAPYGYWARWGRDAEGNGHSFSITGGYVLGYPWSADAAWYHGGAVLGTYEAHVIAGRPALILAGGDVPPVHINIYDPAVNAFWRIVASAIDAWDQDGEPLWPIRVAESLFEPPNAP